MSAFSEGRAKREQGESRRSGPNATRPGADSVLVRAEDMQEIVGLSPGQNTKFNFSGLEGKVAVEFAMGLLGELNNIAEPDYKQFGIVGFGLIARVIVDYPRELHIDVQLSSTECAHKSAIESSVNQAVARFLVRTDLRNWHTPPTITLIDPSDTSIRNAPWGVGVMDSDVKMAFEAIQKQYLVLAAVGYLPRGVMPDAVFSLGLGIFANFKDKPDQMAKLVKSADVIIKQLGGRVPDAAIVGRNRVTMQEMLRQQGH